MPLMSPLRILTILTILSLLVVAASAAASELKIGTFSDSDLSGWEDKVFKGKTVYTLVPENGKTVLQAQSKKAASGLVRKITIDLKKYPFLRWSWKVQAPLKGEDVTVKKGDDFVARVYVAFPRTFFWRTRAINYVWSARMPRGSSAPSPYTGNVMILAIESGSEKAGTWVSEERNVFDDYRQLFGEEPPPVGGVAVMTDTDNTGEEATAWYGDITVHGKQNGAPH